MMSRATFAILARTATRAALAAGLVAVVTVVVRAQSPAAPRWNAWIGCWQAGAEAPANRVAHPIVCITRVDGGASVELATVERERASVIARDTLDASGEQRPFSLQGCTGWRRGEWSRDGRRLFLRSEVSCGEGLNRTSTGVLSISNDGDWIDVQSATAAGNSSVRAAHYRAVTDTAGLPAAFASVVRGNELRWQIARAAAGAPVSTIEVIEATQQLDTLAVQSWLIELGQTFELDGKRIMALANAGVPGSVTDVMVGVSFPRRFQLVEQEPARGAGYARGAGDADRPLTARDSAFIESRYYGQYGRSCVGAWDPMWMPSYYDSYYDPCAYRYGAPGYYGYRSYYGFAAYGGYYGPSYYGNYSGPIVIVRDDEPPHGRLVKGAGYTRGGQRGSTTSSGDNDSPPMPTMRGSSGSDGSKTSPSGSSGSKSTGSSSSGRTAQSRSGKGG
jgi:hypothetical protein